MKVMIMRERKNLVESIAHSLLKHEELFLEIRSTESICMKDGVLISLVGKEILKQLILVLILIISGIKQIQDHKSKWLKNKL